MKIVHIISDLNAFGGAQNLVFNILLKAPLTNSVYVFRKSSDTKLVDQLLNLGIRPVRLTFFSYIKLFLAAINSQSILHFHLTSSFYLALFFPFCVKLYTEHSNHNKRRKHFFLRHFDKYVVYPVFDHIVCISSGVKDNLDFYLKPLKLNTNVVYNFCHPMFNISHQESTRILRKRLLNLSHSPNIVMIGRSSPSKDPDTLLRSLTVLKNSRLILVGPFDQTHLLESARELGVNNRVFFKGIATTEEIVTILNYSHFYIQSSFHEGFGISALQAMSMGLPTLCSSVEGLLEICPSPYLSFPPESFSSIAHIINTLTKNPSMYSHFSELCFNKSLEFSFEFYTSNITKLASS